MSANITAARCLLKAASVEDEKASSAINAELSATQPTEPAAAKLVENDARRVGHCAATRPYRPGRNREGAGFPQDSPG